eukprot:CAMPEP_0201210352 /NCGR_PEP_ID=MMETSP0851-20130426/180111_1 /ASSEMBLY_ACC=CAM_ASM_000631 /TAXON_ID=183588 /ORGANISM="Pseudo-nitzschia fraudulenta, Strain WWA7" /LENGTH=477 /DNA_ID=CAMNT_0047499135 /DNA_START=99 /DNA_END=1529 /DNA_ORIENTATION=-
MDPAIPSSIRAAFVVEGTRGDIQPYLAVALRLIERGNDVKMFTNDDHVSFCESFNIPVEGVLYNFSVAMKSDEVREALAHGNAFKLQKCFQNMRTTSMPEDMKELWPALESFQPTVLLAGGLSKTKAIIYSHAKTVPMVIVDLQIVMPLSDQAPSGLPNLPFGTNKIWFKLLLAGAGTYIKSMKGITKDTLDINMDGKFEIPIMDTIMTDIPSFPGPVCVGTSTFVIPLHPEWPKENFHTCGFFTIGKEKQELMMKDKSKGSQFGSDSNAALTEFLSKGTPPVYVGWGSMLCKSEKWMVTLAVEALQHAGMRGVLLGGWAGLSQEHIPDHLVEYCNENVIFVPSAPHEWLFPQCSCIVHHGGSGTTAASVRSGRPTVITPVIGDQFDFAAGVKAVGCGFGLGQLGSMTGAALGDAIMRCVNEESIIAQAKETGVKLMAEDGAENFCKVLDEWLITDFASGEWIKKHEALLRKCEEHW